MRATRTTKAVHRREAPPRTAVEHRPAPGTASGAVPRLRVGASDDPAEADADRMAAAALDVMAAYQSGAEHQGAEAGAVAGPVHRAPARGHADETSVDAAAVQRASSGGRGLDPDVRGRMEAGFGRDLGGVRVHTGPEAAEVAASIQARAFTAGSDVFFGAGEYRPGTPAGDDVIAHELAHVAQAGAAPDLHRYPATAMVQPVPWSAQTASVFRPGEGASGGVYIMTTSIKDDPVQKAVAKPVFGKNGLNMRETGEQLVASDRIMAQLLGLKAPKSRVVKKGSAEFDELVATCQPYQPAGEEGEEVVPLKDAESFVVMSEVPNAKSIRGLAEKAGTDTSAARDLQRTVFDDRFLSDLGTLVVGDMLVGNHDRMILGAMNLGNIMLSMKEGKGELWAIDTSAVMPHSADPSNIKGGGSLAGGFQNTVRKHIDRGPGQMLDDFFDTLIDALRSGETGPKVSGVPGISEVVEMTYKVGRARWVSAFEFGWDSAMITAMTLQGKEGKAKVSQAMGDARNEEVTPEGFSINAQYIGSRAMGGATHDEAVGRAQAMNLANLAKDWDMDSMVPPPGDWLAPTFTAGDAKALKADWLPVTSLPGLNILATMADDQFPRLKDGFHNAQKYPAIIGRAHAEVDTLSEPTKTKKPLIGKTKVVPRNRNVLGHTVVNTHAVIAGAGRATHLMNDLRIRASDLVPQVAGAKFSSDEITSFRRLLDFLPVAASSIGAEVDRYAVALGQAKSALNTMTSYPDRKAVAAVIDKSRSRITAAKQSLQDVRKLDLPSLSAGLKPSA